MQSAEKINANPKVFAPSQAHKTVSTSLWRDNLDSDESDEASDDEPIDQQEVFGAIFSFIRPAYIPSHPNERF